MNGRSIDSVIFDIGMVLIRWSPHKLYRTLFRDETAIARFLDDTGLLTRNIEFDRGEPFVTGLADLAARHPHHAAELTAFDTRWHETLDGPIPETVHLLSRLRAEQVPNYAITNFSREKFDLAVREFPFLGQFDDIVVSADVRLVKPDPAIFRLLLDRRKLDPARTLFIDDSAKNIATARELGLVTHHFDADNAGALTQVFAAHGLPV